MENNKTPSIRFKGFTDPWEQRKLLSCIEKITDFRGRTPKKLGMDWSESGYLALSALNVKDGYIDFSQDVHYGEQALYDKWMSGNELHKGQVLFTTEAPMGNVAQVPDNKRYILSQRTIAFDVKEDIITENFLATLLRSPAVFNTLTSLSSGGTAKGVSQKSLAGVDIQIPVELREQELLATYFANLDNLITLHQRKYNKLLNVKKSMLEKMFPKNGSNIPEIRFKGFTDPWEQRKLGDVVKEITRNDPESEAPIMMITANNGFIEQSERYAFNNAGESLKKYILLKKGELAYNHGASKLRPYGSCFALTTAENARIPFVYHCFSAENQNAEFMSIELNGAEIENQLRKIVSSGARMDGLLNISFDEYTSVSVLLPGIEEQDCIADFFRQLDNLITLHQRELEKLQNIKKSMLEKMFV